MNVQNDMLSDIELDNVAGGVRHQVTKEEYEKILAQMIADSKKSTPPSTCPR